MAQRVQHIPFGPFVNESERIALEMLRNRLIGDDTAGTWRLLTNIAIGPGERRGQPLEVDCLAIGPPGVTVIEVKHWDREYLDAAANRSRLNTEAARADAKAKRVAGRLRSSRLESAGYVPARFLLTRDGKRKYVGPTARRTIEGVEAFGLPEWREILGLDEPPRLTDAEIDAAAEAIAPGLRPALRDNLTEFGSFRRLSLLHRDRSGYRRVYRAYRGADRDAVWLYLYDLTALDAENPRNVAEREWQVFQQLQKEPCVPSIVDSFQEVSEYPGEMCCFSHVDPGAAQVAERTLDASWTAGERLQFAVKCLEVVRSLHALPDRPICHRNITPQTVLVRASGDVVLTQFQMARIGGAESVAGALSPDFEDRADFVPPELRTSGLEAWTAEADIYAAAATLRTIFEQMWEEPPAREALDTLDQALIEDPALRSDVATLIDDLRRVMGPDAPPASRELRPPLDPKYWDDRTDRELNGRSYRIMTRLGSGGFGSTFKVIEVDREGNDRSGPYVAKVITHKSLGRRAAEAYALVRAQTAGSPWLAGVFEVRSEWRENEITALLNWVPGSPLSEWSGVLSLYFEEQQTPDVEEGLLTWAERLLEGLGGLHAAGLVHGDVSPRNIIVDGLNVTLTDYDLAGRDGAPAGGGTPDYCSPEVDARGPLSPSDDVYALAASLFGVLFDTRPFHHGDRRDKMRGLNWPSSGRDDYPRLAAFLDRATDADRSRRYASARDALADLRRLRAPASDDVPEPTPTPPAPALTPNRVRWLELLLQTYPGSPHGNVETRGLDSPFARETYVETDLERTLIEKIRRREVSLAILCGNAGDGKTAFLQHLAKRLGVSEAPSQRRLFEHRVDGGPLVRFNLDGAASYQGQSAEDVLSGFLGPLVDGFEDDNLVLLLAINDGPLLAWLEKQPSSPLTKALYAALDHDDGSEAADERLVFIDLNTRSLVGGVRKGAATNAPGFVERLIEKLLGSEDTWKPCETCQAQRRCTAWRSVQSLKRPERAEGVKRQLVSALQAVHQRGEIHITARELRAALAYIFFGVHTCHELHADPNLQPLHYWDRAFGSKTSHRQGELLRELQALDPALDAHPVIDRRLRHRPVFPDGPDEPHPENRRLASRRRHAFFEWSEAEFAELRVEPSELRLFQGRHLERFRVVSAAPEDEVASICDDLCAGLARLEDLPDRALSGAEAPLKTTPLRIIPRTPTETVFWVRKPRERFSLHAHLPRVVEGVDALHTHVVLSYAYADGRSERLFIDARLFHLLMELKDGYQLADVLSDDVFANLSIFTQRLVQEDDSTLHAWNPSDSREYRVSIDKRDGVQVLQLTPLCQEEPA